MPGQGSWADRSRQPKPLTFGLSGFGGASVFLQPGKAWWKSVTPGDMRPCIAIFEAWEIAPGAQELPCRPDYLFIQPVVLGVAFGCYLKPFALQTYGRVIRHTLASLADCLSVLHPEGLRFLGVLLGWFAH
jgi:hypothetical protein